GPPGAPALPGGPVPGAVGLVLPLPRHREPALLPGEREVAPVSRPGLGSADGGTAAGGDPGLDAGQERRRRNLDRRAHAALLPLYQPAGGAGAEPHHSPAVSPGVGWEQADAPGVVHDGELRPEELRPAVGVRDAAGGIGPRTG